jgi:hypothetical protein
MNAFWLLKQLCYTDILLYVQQDCFPYGKQVVDR